MEKQKTAKPQKIGNGANKGGGFGAPHWGGPKGGPILGGI